MFTKKFPFYKQLDQNDCGAACLRIISKYYGKILSAEKLRQKAQINTRDGLNLDKLSKAAEKLGFRTLAARLPFDKLVELPTPFIAHWRQNHYIVVYEVSKNKIKISDPSFGLVTYSPEEFKKGWVSLADNNGITLVLETSADFEKEENDSSEKEQKVGLKFFGKYFLKFKRLFFQIILATIIGNLLQLIAPFLSQALVDKGIVNQDLGFIQIILIGQIVLTLSTAINSFLSSWVGLHVGSRMGLAIISDFFAKLMRLPISFFDKKTSGDITQRLRDHSRITSFISASTIGVFLSLLNLFVYGTYMAIYSLPILFVFIIGTLLHMGWVFLFLKPRKDLDYKNFHVSAENETKILELIQGVNEIKLNNIELKKRWEWESIQARIFKLKIKSLTLDQYQSAGSLLISQLKDVIITYLTATAVVEGKLSLGMMVSIQFIIGQLGTPFYQFIGLIQQGQSAKIALERLGDIHNAADEDANLENIMADIPNEKNIEFNNVSFKYEGSDTEAVKNINIKIKQGASVAIVGRSGSGKTTLLKLLLKYYVPTTGEIKIGNTNLQYLPSGEWRKKCGVVMQEGFIFADSIAKNIALDDEVIDRSKLNKAVTIGNIKDHIESLPLAYNTKIGKEGRGLSQGQKQRLLIARAVYKEPDVVFFDEATNNLDAENESVILDNLKKYIPGKTVITVAHRLSTVKNADLIIVIDKGEIVEQGTHQELVNIKGLYFKLVKNQLDLGN